MKPRVLFLDQSGELGGAELYLLDVARHYWDSARVVLFQEGPFYERLIEEGIAAQVLEAPSALLGVTKQARGMQGLRALPDVFRLVRRVAHLARDYDVLYANSQKALVVASLAGVLARRPVIWNLHDILTAEHFSVLNRWIAAGLANTLVERVIVNSRATRRAFAESSGRIEKTAVVYNGIDATSFGTASPEEARALKSELGLDGQPTVGVFSRLAPWKGQHVLIEALAEIPEVQAVLVGDALFGPDAHYEEELHELAERLGVRERVHFLGFRDDVPILMRMTDIVVHTSVAPEPFGRVIVEGMLTQRPVIASRAGGAMEIVDSGNTGLLVAPGDPAALAEALRELLEQPAKADAMAQRGREAAEARFSVQAMLEGVDAQIAAVV